MMNNETEVLPEALPEVELSNLSHETAKKRVIKLRELIMSVGK